MTFKRTIRTYQISSLEGEPLKKISFNGQYFCFYQKNIDNTYFLFSYINIVNQNSVADQEFKNRGRGPGAAQFLRSEDCFNALSYIPYAFVMRVENKIQIVNIAC